MDDSICTREQTIESCKLVIEWKPLETFTNSGEKQLRGEEQEEKNTFPGINNDILFLANVTRRCCIFLT
jgi:hypothetical protein